MKKILFAILICISTQNFGYSQSYSFWNSEILSVYNIICCDSTISLNMYLVNITQNEIYMYQFYKPTALAIYNDKPERLYIEHGESGRYFTLEFVNKIIKLSPGDTLFFDSKINCENVNQIKFLTIKIDYINPYIHGEKETHKILKIIKPYPIDMENNKGIYIFTDRSIYSRFCNVFKIEVPWNCNDFKQTQSD